MQVIIAKSAGYCFGVRRAVDAIEERLARGEKLCTLGRLTHNAQAVEDLARRGAEPVDTPEECVHPLLAIRAHGVTPDVLARAKAAGLEILDLTCPFVARIHELVRAWSLNCDDPVIIVGKASHPEVTGTRGWCGRSFVIEDIGEIAALPQMDRALLVAQTTCENERFERVEAALKQRIPQLESHNTVCSTSRERQREAAQLAAKADMMIVVGGRDSANTRELYNICRARAQTLWVETARDLPEKWAGPWGIIGITAGASTPDGTSKEVAARMNDIETQDMIQETQESTDAQSSSFMEDVEKTMVQIHKGDVMKGKVVQITEDEVCVSIGYKSDGLIKRADLIDTEAAIGDEIEVEVVQVNDGDGNVILSQRNIANRRNWEVIKAKSEAGEYVVGVGKRSVKGGLIADVMGIEAFVPASQLSQRYVEKIDDFVGKEMTLKIKELDDRKKRIVASRKEVLLEEAAARKAEIWDKLEQGSIVTGIVRRLTDFGAFVDIGGVDGLVHVTDLSWGRVQHPRDVVNPGDEIQVKIQKLDRERERISLSLKATKPKPWDVAGEKYQVGTVVEGKVVRITTFGAFVELEPGLDGLVHISQCALNRIAKVEDAVQVGQTVRVKILDVNPDLQRISLSIRGVLEDEAFDDSEGETFDDEYALGTEEAADEVADAAEDVADTVEDAAEAVEDAAETAVEAVDDAQADAPEA